MELEVFLPPRGLVKCCNCSCTTCALIGAPSNSWFRSVKRKYNEFETGNMFYFPGLDLYSNARVQIENECAALRETVNSQQATIEGLYSELEEERSASSSAATEAMSMILKLQSEKAEIEMESRQFKRFTEEKMSHEQDEILVLEDLLYKREQTIQALTCEAQAYKHRMLSYGFTEEEVEGEKDGQMWQPSVAEDFNAEVDLPAYDYPPLKCILNGNHGYGVEDVEKYAFGEIPRSQEHLTNLEERISQMERNPNSSQLDGEIPGTRNVLEKVVVGHSPRRPRHSRRHSTDSTNSFFSREMGSEFISDSPKFAFGSPGYNTSFKKMELVSEMDKILSLRRINNASEVGDDMSDRVYTIDSVRNEVPYNGTAEHKHGLRISDNYASTPRETFNLPDVSDPDLKKLYMRLQNLEADRESMRQALLSMRTDKAQLVLLKEIAQHLCKEMSPEKQVVAKPSILGSLFKWIVSPISRRRRALRSKYLYGLSPNNVGLLMVLDKGPRLRQWRCLSKTQV
ncbi:Myosin-binding protein 7 [Hibiscus syriacus]|uniref:Myosin-binding protein 7 n=1 Tax=Hibiscus syriacus TaxID=106335 RepID=A0A6A3AKQ9_HIBSY|nr:myosin-binding protein 7-like [Hibiscus syriacus]XP_039000189.1 myosin-binding protein 7-like [Hibiscus syriacus]KAE8704618.1 Myosin-binding protein 7 [Hibiscus syriacus]